MGSILRLYAIAAAAVALAAEFASAYRLPTAVLPQNYNLEIIVNVGDENGKFDFKGNVWINVKCEEPTSNITLHAKNLSIKSKQVTVRDEGTNKLVDVNAVDFDKENDFMIVNLRDKIEAGSSYEIFIPYEGVITESLAGLYRSHYTDKHTNETRWMAITQFEPSDARLAIPCFDEPMMKAKFTISIGRSGKYLSISNMPQVKTEPIPDKDGWFWDRYEESEVMSTYLVAFAVCDFKYLESSCDDCDNNVTFKIWARKDAIDQVGFAKEMGPRFLHFYERYFDIRYPLPKQDMIAVPDFSAGAMENWGLITYRETYLLFDPAISSILYKLSVASVIAHELAHQWFGNLVTMKWWTDLWLNEGFATYMSAIAVNELLPEWNSLQEDTADNLLAVFTFDSLQSSHQVSVPIGNPKVIPEIFDTISYKKGSYLLHMMSNFLGKETLRKGVSNYLKQHKYRNAEQDDLWLSITKEAHIVNALPSNLTVKTIMDTWTLQTGYPLITVNRNYGGDCKPADVVQERFLKDRLVDHGETRWWVPITYMIQGQTTTNVSTKPNVWLSPDGNATLSLSCSENSWVLLNVNASGLYRINYDKKNWDLLIDALNSETYSDIPLLNRVQLIDDSTNLAWVGKLNYTVYFNVLNYLKRENEYIPWKVASRSIGNIDSLIRTTSIYGKFKAFNRELTKKIYQKIGGFKPMLEKDHKIDAIQFRALVTTAACKYEAENCTVQARILYKNLMNSSQKTEDVPKDIRGVIYCTGIKYGGEREWKWLWRQYLSSNVATEKSVILKSLGCTRQPWMLQMYLEWALDSKSGIRKQDISLVFSAVISNEIGFQVARNFLTENIKKLHDTLQPTINKMSSIFMNLANYMSGKVDYNWFVNFAEENKEYLKEIKNGMKQAMETAKLNVRWREENLKNIVTQLEVLK